MTAKEYLSQAKQLDDAINRLLNDRTYWRDLSKKVSGSNFEEHFNANRSAEAPFARCLERIDEIERDIDRKVDALADLRTKINKAIDALEDLEEQIVLRRRYLEGYSWEQTARSMAVSIRTAHRIHGRALKHFSIPE